MEYFAPYFSTKTTIIFSAAVLVGAAEISRRSAFILAELAVGGFRTLLARMSEAEAELAPIERLTLAAHSYISFGAEQPAVFRLMFTRDLVAMSRYPGVQAEADAAMTLLSAIVAKVVPASKVADATLAAWSLVHGYTSLCIEAGIEGPALRTERTALFARAIAGLA